MHRPVHLPIIHLGVTLSLPASHCGTRLGAWKRFTMKEWNSLKKMRQYRNAVDIYVEPYANHDIIYLGKNLGFTVEAVKVVNLQEGTSKDEGSKEKTLG